MMEPLNFDDSPRMTEPTARGDGRLLLRGMGPPTVFDMLSDAPKHGSILNRFEGAWWHLLADGRFFFEPARLNDSLSNNYILQGVYQETNGSFILLAESYRLPENLLALDCIIRPEKGQYALYCLFLNERDECPALYLTQTLTTEDKRGMLDSSQVLTGVPVPALFDLELTGNTTSGSFSAVQACLYTAPSMSDFSASEPDEVHFSISNGSVIEAAEEQNGTCSLLLPIHTLVDAAFGVLPSERCLDLAIKEGHIQLNIEDISNYQPIFSWFEAKEIPDEAGGQPRRSVKSCEARNLTLDCRVTGDNIVGEIHADGATLWGEQACYEATIKGRRAADAPQTLAQLEQKLRLLSQQRSWQDKNIFHGDWHSQRFGEVQLQQDGSSVTGIFAAADGNGSLAGTAAEHCLIFRWASDNAAGQGILHAVRGGQFLAGYLSRTDSSALAHELFYRHQPSSSLVEETLRSESDPFAWNRLADSLKSLYRNGEALILYEKTYEAFGEKRELSPSHTERWSQALCYEWGALLNFMHCCQMQNILLAHVHAKFRGNAEDEAKTYDRLLHALEHAIQLQAELYSLAQKAEADADLIFPVGGALLTKQIELWRSSLSDEASRMKAMETSQQAFDRLLKVLASARSYEQALVVAESARARAFSDLMQTRIYREQAQASLSELKTEDVEKFMAKTMATTAPIDLEMLEQTARTQRSTIVEYFLSDDELFTWVISPDGEINFHHHQQQNLRQSLTDLIALTRTSMGVQSRDAVLKSVVQSGQQFLPQLAQLYRLLVEPIVRWLPKNEYEQIIFIPHGTLFFVPFPALFDQQTYFIERHTISIAPSIRFIETTHQLAITRKTGPSGLLIVGDPLMPVWRWDNHRPAERLPPLEFARKEAQQIARRLKTTAVLGADACKESILRLLPQQRLIHLATHGLLDDNGPPAEMPGAIALAPAGEDDGFLTAAQIAALDLHAKLVVMSACNTGRGRLSADGITGLMRAFLTAGAECVMASLWAVADRSTQELMVGFYGYLLRGLPIAQALRRAMLTLKADKRYDNPLYWAAFTVTGESQMPLFSVARNDATLVQSETRAEHERSRV